jgi:hypothetical protein
MENRSGCHREELSKFVELGFNLIRGGDHGEKGQGSQIWRG